ncbi:MAG: hypothetical protein MZV65_44310 [Chromatiales bacterium]|nr:hypothetical protein [Chromatiales bacterium]
MLVKSDSGPDTVAWVERIRVGPDPWPSSVASVWVETSLPGALADGGGRSTEGGAAQMLEAHVLPVRLVPYRLDKHTQVRRTPALPNPGTLDIELRRGHRVQPAPAADSGPGNRIARRCRPSSGRCRHGGGDEPADLHRPL